MIEMNDIIKFIFRWISIYMMRKLQNYKVYIYTFLEAVDFLEVLEYNVNHY